MIGQSTENQGSGTTGGASDRARGTHAPRPILERCLALLRRVTGRSREPRFLIACPRCGGALNRSRVRSYEAWRRALSPSRPFRCLACRRRVWARPDPPVPVAPLSDSLRPEPVSLTELDKTWDADTENRSPAVNWEEALAAWPSEQAAPSASGDGGQSPVAVAVKSHRRIRHRSARR